jgi:hypothetical protein
MQPPVAYPAHGEHGVAIGMKEAKTRRRENAVDSYPASRPARRVSRCCEEDLERGGVLQPSWLRQKKDTAARPPAESDARRLAEVTTTDRVRQSKSQRQIPDGEAHRHQLALKVTRCQAGRLAPPACTGASRVQSGPKRQRFGGFFGVDEPRFVARGKIGQRVIGRVESAARPAIWILTIPCI